MTDFFISYTHANSSWAEWIGYVLEEEGYSVVIQAWDFRPGGNFVIEMQEAAVAAERTLMVLSPAYLRSQFATPEWAAAFGNDPQGRDLKLVPVMVEDCTPQGLLAAIVQIRIVGKGEEAARDTLLAGVRQKRAKPSSRPAFPGAAAVVQPKPFPGPASKSPLAAAAKRATPLIPPLNRQPNDADRRRFARETFETINRLFAHNLVEIARTEARIETDFQPSGPTDFRAEIFLDGNSACVCRIWLGWIQSPDTICYGEGRHAPGNSVNELLSLSRDEGLAYQVTMAAMNYGFEGDLDLERLSADSAAEYLWRRFVHPLGRR